ncbi:MAG: 3-phosphoshikimate 1-carboxyvinyltransferase, partial [Erysipelotrichaceae bacterium]|nr:3-phosphoshikimate 1-carboxyvinyltransferase [Erysipelotrichaceae bacterium]
MKVIINPSQLAFPHVTVPPSKSLAHRAVICAALAKGVSRIDNIDYSVDIKATLTAMEVLGAKVFYGENYVLIEGINSIKQTHELHINCQESGSTLRFLIPVFSLCGQKVTFIGKGRLMQRPQSVYEQLFENAHSPLKRMEHQLVVDGPFQPGEIHL